MEKFQELRETARKKIVIAEHMVNVTYPLVKDSRLLMAIAENIFLAMSYAMNALLYYEYVFKRIEHVSESFEEMFHTFKEKCVKKYSIKEEYIKMIRDIKDVIMEHKKSPMEFSRKDRYIICSDNYKLRSISIDQLKSYIPKAKLFIQDINSITVKDERIFG